MHDSDIDEISRPFKRFRFTRDCPVIGYLLQSNQMKGLSELKALPDENINLTYTMKVRINRG